MGEITMASKYESKIGQIPCNDQLVYSVLSNLENLQRFMDAIPQDKVKELEITPDAIRMKIDGMAQKFTIRIVEKEENKTIIFILIGLQAPFKGAFLFCGVVEDGALDVNAPKLILRFGEPL